MMETDTENQKTKRDPLSFSFKDISYKVKKSKGEEQILYEISGYVPPKSFLAIMGHSGSGKTSLLDVLAGRNKIGEVTGQISINGNPLSSFSDITRKSIMRNISGYVMQDSALIETLTVRETLYYALKLRKGEHKQEGNAHTSQTNDFINSILTVLNLKKVADSTVGDPIERGISGGERCRLAIGVELVISPSILFMDEPTSGLDSTNALRVMTAIHHLCSMGHTIISTIHQPRSNIFNMFDYLLLLHEGHMVYFGTAKLVTSYFKQLGIICPPYINPADFLMDLLEKEEEDDYEDEDDVATVLRKESAVPVSELADVYRRSEFFPELMGFVNQTEEKPKKKNNSIDVRSLWTEHHTVSVWEQYLTLVERTWKATVRDSGVMYVRTGAALLIGFLVGTIFFQQPNDISSVGAKTNTILFLMCVFSLFCLPAIDRFIKDRLLFTRERASGFYSTTAYFLASFTVELPMLLMIVIGYGCISYWMVGLEPRVDSFIFFLAIIFLVIQVGFSVSQVISSAVNSLSLAIAIYMIVLVYSLLMGGFIVRPNDMPTGIQWAFYTSYFWYGYQALIINEFDHKSYAKDIITDISFGGSDKFVNLGILACMWLLLQVIAYFIVVFFNKEKR